MSKTQTAPTKPKEAPVTEKPIPTGMVPVADTTPQQTGVAIPEYDGEESGGSLASLLFYGRKAGAERAMACKAAGVPMFSFYLKDNLGVVKLTPPRIFVLGGQTACYATFDDKMKMTSAKPFTRDGTPPEGPLGRYSEHRVGMVLVPNDDDTKLAMVVFSTNGPMCKLWEAVNNAQGQAKGAGLAFGGRSKDHKEAVACDCTQARFFAEISGIEKTSPAGFVYNLGQADVKPTPAKLRDLVSGFLAEHPAKDQKYGIPSGLQAVYDRRVADIQQLIAKAA